MRVFRRQNICIFSNLLFYCLFVCLMVFNAIFNNISVISWRSVLLVAETGVPGGNRRPAASHWQTLLNSVVHLALIEIGRKYNAITYRGYNLPSSQYSSLLDIFIIEIYCSLINHLLLKLRFSHQSPTSTPPQTYEN